MKKFQLLWLFCCAFLLAVGQENVHYLSGTAYIDSLIQELPKYGADTSKVKLLTTISLRNDEYNPGDGVKYGEMALALSEKLGWKEGVARSAIAMGNNHMSLGNNSVAMGCYKRALDIYGSLGNKKGSAQAMGNMALFYCGISDYVNALAYWLHALSEFEAINDTPGIANQLGNIAMVYQEQGNYTKALLFTQRAMSMYRQMRDRDAEAMQLSNLANTYDRMGRADEALAAYSAAAAIYDTTGNKVGAARNLMNMGSTYCSKKEYARAFDCQFRALEIYMAHNAYDDIGVVFSNLAEEYYQIATDTALIKTGKYLHADRKTCLARAIEYAQKAIEYHSRVNNLAALSYTCRVLANAQMRAGRAEEAIQNYAMHEMYRDSVFTIENNLKIAGLDWKRELELKDKQLELDRLAVAKKKNERYFYIGGIALLLLVAAITIRNVRLSAAKELSENRLNAFQARMNPHFIFNSLNTIQSLVLKNETIPSIRYLSEFSKLMRQILDSSAKSRVRLSEEVEMLRSYITLEQLRYKNFTWEITVDDNIDAEGIFIPGMIVQPFVENCIVHGFHPDRKDGLLAITFTRAGKQVICTVEDNGIGRAKAAELNRERSRERQSHGINIATSRLTLLNDKKRGIINRVAYTDKMENGQPMGTKVVIQIPVLWS